MAPFGWDQQGCAGQKLNGAKSVKQNEAILGQGLGLEEVVFGEGSGPPRASCAADGLQTPTGGASKFSHIPPTDRTRVLGLNMEAHLQNILALFKNLFQFFNFFYIFYYCHFLAVQNSSIGDLVTH